MMRHWVWVAMTMMMVSGLAAAQSVVGIWHEPSITKQSGHADPKFLAQLLQRHGFPVRLLSTEDLANPQALTPQKVALVVLPYGAFFPAEAVDNFRRYLKAGGKFVSLGGYTFDETRDMGQGTRGIKWEGEAPAEPKWEKVAHEKVQVIIARNRIRIAVPKDAPVDWHRARTFMNLRSGWRYLLTGKVQTDGIQGGHGAYLAADYYDANGNRIAFQQTQIVQRTDGWRELGVVLKIPDNTERVAINAIVHGHGVAEFADISIKPVINARWGDARDWMHIDPDQFAIFDPSFRIDGATTLEWGAGRGTGDGTKWGKGQGTWGKGNGVVVKTKEPMKGYAAVGLIGSNDPVNPKAWARFVPILIARDRFGRFLGPAFSILHHFAGPYAGSSWAFCGIESHDLTKFPEFQKVLVDVIRRLLDGVYLHSLQPSLWCYRFGEKAQVSVKVRNDGSTPKTVTVRMEIAPMPKPLKMGKFIVLGERTVTLSPKEQTTVTMEWEIPRGAAPLFAIRATLIRPSLVPRPSSLDEVWSGFCVWDEKVLRQALPIEWQGNALHEWDEEENRWRPRFWLGTNQTGVMFAPEATWENPLQWEFEFALMRRMGLSILRVLHISHFAGDLEKPTESFWRRYDALVLMAHRHGLVLMPCLHDWMGVSVDDETLRKQCTFVRLIGARYKNARRILWDIENEAWVEIRDHPDLRRMFNEWLKERYGDEAKLQSSWGEPVKFGIIPFAPHQPRGWNDLKFRDIQHFRRWLVERWVKANVQALRESGAKQPVTDEIDWKVSGDHYEASHWLTFINLHYYGNRSPEAIATTLKFHERLHRGQGLAVGEFGARDHPSFRFGGWGYGTSEEVIRHFLNLPLLTYALGGTMALNWDWKDMEACIFPWGLVHQHGIWATAQSVGQGTRDKGQTKVWKVEAALKTAGKAMVATAKLVEQLEPILPANEESWVALVVPDEHLLGVEGEFGFSGTGPRGRISAAVYRAIEAMLRLKTHFRIVREWDLVANGEKFNYPIAVFPVPFVWRDETFEAVKRFVEQGGIAIITGDFTFDPDRKRTRTQRLKTLLGFDFVSGISSPFDLDTMSTVRCVATDDQFELTEWQGKPCVVMGQGTGDMGQETKILAMTEKGVPLVVARKLGKGLVVFCADAPEFRSVDETVRLYKALLKRATKLKGMKPELAEWALGRQLEFGVEPDLLMFCATEGIGWVFVTANPTDKAQLAHFRAGSERMRISVLPKSVGVLRAGSHGEAEDALFVGDFWGVGSYTQLLAKAEGLTVLIGQLPFIPLQPGEIQIRCVSPKVKVTVCDLLTGKALLSYQAEAKDGWLRFKVPPELVLTQWRIVKASSE